MTTFYVDPVHNTNDEQMIGDTCYRLRGVTTGNNNSNTALYAYASVSSLLLNAVPADNYPTPQIKSTWEMFQDKYPPHTYIP